MDDRYTIETDTPGWYIVTDRVSGIRLRFKEHYFNESQEAEMTGRVTDPALMATAMREMGDWLVRNHSDILFPITS